MADSAVRVVIEGRVQGVGYRAWMVRAASHRGLKGWVRNRSDGSVEALLIGELDEIDAMIETCRRGPAHAHVAGVARFEAPGEDAPPFHARPTV